MKRDLELIRRILMSIEEREDYTIYNLEIDGYSSKIIFLGKVVHINCLSERNFTIGKHPNLRCLPSKTYSFHRTN